jgi:hypothetical protein
MRVLLANLKHLYQRRLCWFFYVLFGWMLWSGSSTGYVDEQLGIVWMFALVSGMSAGFSVMEVMSKPFICLLPAHPPAARKVVFIIGFAVSVLAGVSFARHTSMDVSTSLAVFCAAACTSLALYLVGVAWTLIPWPTLGPQWAVVLGLLFAAMICSGQLLLRYLRPVIVHHPLSTILCGVAMSVVIWRLTGRPQWHRQAVSGALRSGGSVTQRQYAVMGPSLTRAARALAAVESFFLARMTRCSHYTTGPYLWGTLYATFGVLAAWWRWLALGFVALIVLCGYAGPFVACTAFLYISFMATLNSWPPVRSTLLVPSGRRERLLGTLSLAAATAGVLAFCVLVVSLVSVPLSLLIPAVEIWGLAFAYRQVPALILFVPLIAVPLHAIPYVLLPRTWPTYICPIIGAALTVLLLLATGFVRLWFIIMDAPSPFGGPRLWSLTVVVLWTLFAAAASYRVIRCSLGGS